MIRKRMLTALAAVALLGACNSAVPTGNVPLETLPTKTSIKSSQSIAWHIQDVRVNVSETLKVSEAHLYLPDADIVWREDPFGDRRAQVKNIIDMAASQAVLNMDGTNPVYLDIEVKKFHALSQKARATVGGRHWIQLEICIRDVTTDVELVDPIPIDIKLKAFGGRKAYRS